MTQGSCEDVRAYGTKRLLPYFGELRMTKIGVAAVREWCASMLEAVEAGEWAVKTVNNARIALLGCFRMAVEDRLMPITRARRAAVADRVRRAPVPAAGPDPRLRRRLRATLPAAGGIVDRHRRASVGG
jgi:hypothetical protein